MTRIAAIEVQPVPVSARTTWQLIVVRDTDGRTGLGECSDSGSVARAARLVARFQAALLGRELDAALARLDALRAGLDASPGGERFAARTVAGGLATAFADLAAQRAQMPLWAWLGAAGRPPRTVELYANLNRSLGARRPEDFARRARAAVANGFRTVKIAPFDHLSAPNRTWAGIERAWATREAIGPHTGLMIDIHHALSLDELLGIADELAALGLRWLEDTAGLHDLASLRVIREAVGAPLAGGELAASVAEVAPALDAGLIDVVMPDVKHAGGPAAALELAAAARAGGAAVSLHNPSGPVATAASLHTSIAAGATLLEYAYGETSWRGDLVAPPERPVEGRLRVPDEPGLGLRLAWPSTAELTEMAG
jgi:galactonate dehydratase